jgi:phosphatidate cytidylyltransferase
MKQRVISAILFAAVMLIGVLWNVYTFTILFGAITLGCLWEFAKLVFASEQRYLTLRKVSMVILGMIPYIVTATAMTGLTALAQDGSMEYLYWIFLTAIPLVFALLILELFLESPQPFANVAFYTLGLFYLGMPFCYLLAIAINGHSFAAAGILGLLLLNWANDSFAYLVGTFIGKTPFAPSISPKKTWEGTLGGMVCTILAGYGLSFLITDFSPTEWWVLAAIVAIIGTLGDLVESMLKRSLKIKDSGNILPGHGGFLDRFDSFVFVLPFAWLALWLLRL